MAGCAKGLDVVDESVEDLRIAKCNKIRKR